jgi:hypothetical protein
MPPTSAITLDALKAALKDRGGCVVKVADDLGLSRNEVYRKVRTYGIDLNDYRQQDITYSSDGMSSNDPRVTELESVTMTVQRAAHRFGGMVEQVASATVDIGAEILSRTRRPKQQTTRARLTSEQERDLMALRREMSSALNTDISDSEVLQWFHKRYFAQAVADFRASMLNGDGQ